MNKSIYSVKEAVNKKGEPRVCIKVTQNYLIFKRVKNEIHTLFGRPGTYYFATKPKRYKEGGTVSATLPASFYEHEALALVEEFKANRIYSLVQ